jgi:F0F1-type ATP synthase membrane subunit c/vacuolar-type H+-ATPase subunit K
MTTDNQYPNNPSRPASPRPQYPGDQPQGASSYPGNAQQGGSPYPGNHPGSAYPPAQQPYGAQPQVQYAQLKPFSTKAIIAIVMGGVSVLMYPLAIITGPIGVVVGWLGMRESKQPHGTHRGWGLALAGLIMSGAMFVIGIGIGILFVWLFMFVNEQQEQENQRRIERQAESAVDEDLNEIQERLRFYYDENNRSLGTGGPVLKDGHPDGLLGDDWPRVTGELKLADLVTSYDLNNALADYELKVTGTHSATVTSWKEGRQLQVTYSGTWRQFSNLGDKKRP